MNLNNSSDSFNELIFEDRNKEYGAYALRTSYKQNVSRSLFITMGMFGLLTLLAIWMTNRKVEIPDIDVFSDPGILVDVTPKVDPIKPIDPVKKDNTAPKTDNPATVVVDAPIKPVDKDPNGNISKNPNPVGPPADSIPKEPVIPFDPPPLPPPIVKIPDKMPELADLYNIITRNLKYPHIAVDNGTSGTVYIEFIVNVDGSISDIEVKKPLQDGCTEEAVRVVKLLKGWTPGIKDGKPVRVPCTLPIKFRLK